jgi:hypothetical protein
MDIVALFERAPGNRVEEPGEDTDIGMAVQRVLLEIDEIAEATLRSISLKTMLKSPSTYADIAPFRISYPGRSARSRVNQ